MAGVHGEKLYGRVDRVPGEAYVSTMFFHINYVPLIPLRTFLIVDGTEKGGQFQGALIPIRIKSILVGYLRGWLAATAIIASIFVVISLMNFFEKRPPSPLNAIVAIGSIVLLLASIWYTLATESNRYITVLALQIGLAYTWWSFVVAERIGLPGAAKDKLVKYWPAFPIVVGALVAYSLTRYFTHARIERSIDEEFESAAR